MLGKLPIKKGTYFNQQPRRIPQLKKKRVLTATVKSGLVWKYVTRVFKMMATYKYKEINRYMTTQYYLTLVTG